MYELPSGDYSPQPYTRLRASVAPRFGVLIAVWFIVVVAYGGYRMFIGRKPDAPVQVRARREGFVARAALAGWKSQAHQAATAAVQSETQLRMAEAEVRRTLSLTTSLVEGKHLHAALAKLEAAHQGLERTRYDIDSLETLLKGEEKQ